MRPAVAYLRDSGGPEQQLSISQQLEQVGVFCMDQGYTLIRTFKDTASGGSTVGRDQFLQMIDYLHTGATVDAVIFWAYSRFARDYDDNQYYLADIRRHRINVVSITDTIPEGLDGRLLESVIAWKNAIYRRDLSRDVRRALKYLTQHHRAWHGGKPPVGYVSVKEPISPGADRLVSRLVPDPEFSPIIHKAFRMRADGHTLKEIQAATHLVSSVAATGRLLRNPMYIGTAKYNGDLYPDFCEPIITKALWDDAQRVGAERRKMYGYNHPRTVRSSFILTGLLSCMNCGKPMHGRVTKNNVGSIFRYYRCQGDADGDRCGARSIPQDLLETKVTDTLITALNKIDFDEIFKNAAAEIEAQVSHLHHDLAVHQGELDDINKQITHVINAITATGHSAALLDQLDKLETQRDERYTLTTQLAAQIQIDTPAIDLESIKTDYQNWSNVLPSADIRTKRRILQATILQIIAQRKPDNDIDLLINYTHL